MITTLKKLFTRKSPENKEKNDFSDFFLHAKSKDKAKVIRRVLKEASDEQRALMKKYQETKTA